MRLRIPVSEAREWVSIIPRADRSEVLVVRESGEELVVGVEPDEPLEPQISATLLQRDTTH
jgi:hypothetical protein